MRSSWILDSAHYLHHEVPGGVAAMPRLRKQGPCGSTHLQKQLGRHRPQVQDQAHLALVRSFLALAEGEPYLLRSLCANCGVNTLSLNSLPSKIAASAERPSRVRTATSPRACNSSASAWLPSTSALAGIGGWS